MTIKSLVGTVMDTSAQEILILTENGERRVEIYSNPMDDLLENKRFVGYNATYTSNGSHYTLELSKDFTKHVLHGSLQK